MSDINPAQLAAMQFQAFYLRYGVRNDSQIKAPHLLDRSMFALPLKSIYHHVDYSGTTNGPGVNEVAFAGNDKPVYYQNVENLADHLGNPRQISLSTQLFNRDLRQENRKLRPLQNVELAARDQHTIVCMNYCFLSKNYRYTRSALTEYYRWHNIFSSIVAKMAELAEKLDSHQFLFVNVPPLVPSMTQFAKAEHTLDVAALKFLTTPNSFTAFDIWRWLGENRRDSVLAKIPETKLKYINLVYFEQNKWTILNLHYLNALRKPEDQEAWDNASLGPNAGMSPHQTQMRFTLFLTKVMEARMVSAISVDDVQGTHIDKASQDTLMQQSTQIIEDQVGVVIDDDKVETAAEKAARLAQDDSAIEQSLAGLNEIAERIESKDGAMPTVEELLARPPRTTHEEADARLNELADMGIMTQANYKRLQTLSREIDKIKMPGTDQSLTQYQQPDMSKAAIVRGPIYVDNPTVVDKSMLESTVEAMDRQYVTEFLKKDVVACVTHLNRGGYFVTGFEATDNHDILGSTTEYRIKLTPIEGQPSTIPFRLPVFKPDGSFRTNGVDYQLSKLFSDQPIRKISPKEVALTSNYGKVFVERGRKVTSDATQWYLSQTMLAAVDEQSLIKSATPADVFDPDGKYPRDYSAMAHGFSVVELKDMTLHFSTELVSHLYGTEKVKQYAKQGLTLLGVQGQDPVLMDMTGAVLKETQGTLVVLGRLWQVLGFKNPPPVEYAEVSVYGQAIPVGLILAYYNGLTSLFKLLGVEPRRIPAGTRVRVEEQDEYALVFQDETIILPRDNPMAMLVLAGFRDYHAIIKQYAVHNFDKRAVYASLLEAKAINARFLREIDLLKHYFVDPVTMRLLVQMKEPTDWQGLLLRSCQLLVTDEHLNEISMEAMRIKSTERAAGAVYACMIAAIRRHNGMMGKANRKVEMNPYEVWKTITEDPAKFQKNEINPVHAIKESEALTFSGEGGRSKQSMVKDTRYFHPSHMGIVSEATKDSGDVGINVFLSPNANLTDVYGNVRMWDEKKDGSSSLISTPVLLAPGSDGDDQKRVGFASIQISHTIAADGYHQPTVRTGYETVLPQRLGETFCVTAKQPGKVDSVTEHGIRVTYADGTKEGYRLGRHFGSASGLTLPHQLMTSMKAGQGFEVGHAITYNSGFIEPDILDPRRPVYKCSMEVKTVFWESTQTLEDACSISPRLAEGATTKMTKVKDVQVKFTDVVNNLIQVGARVEYDSIICVIQDSVSGNSGAFSDETMDALAVKSNQVPRAGVRGVVERIEVFYHGDVDDMSDTCKAITNKYNAERKRRNTDAGKPDYTGSVDSGFRIDGVPLDVDMLNIRIYITTPVLMAVGDKGVFANQLKTVCSEVMSGEYRTENNELVDAIFGNQSVDARIVTSVYRIGLLTLIQQESTRLALAAYDS